MSGIYSAEYGEFINDALTAADGTGIVLSFFPMQPVEIIRAGFICEVATTGTVGSFSVNAFNPSGSYGTVSIPNLAAGKGVSKNLVDDTTLRDRIIPVGGEFRLTVSVATTAGDGWFFVQYKPVGNSVEDGRSVNAQRVVST